MNDGELKKSLGQRSGDGSFANPGNAGVPGVAPGKTAATSKLGGVPIQRKTARGGEGAPASASAGAADLGSWTDVVFRPDLYSAPVQAKSADSTGGSTDSNPDKAPGVAGTDAAGKPVEAQEGERFLKGPGDTLDIEPNDVTQGSLGDCYLMAALAATAKTDPELIRNMVKHVKDNTFSVTFQLDGKAKTVIVDSTVPVWKAGGDPVFAKVGDRVDGKKELWVLLVEKAWASVKGSYNDIRGSKVPEDMLEVFSGKATKHSNPANLSEDELLATLKAAVDAGHPVVLDSIGDAHEKAELAGKQSVITNHGYSLMGVDVAGKTVNLFNPWGRKHDLNAFPISSVKKFFRNIRVSGG